MSAWARQREAPLVGGNGGAGCAPADRRAAREQGHGLRRPAVVAQRGQQRVAADQVVAAQMELPEMSAVARLPATMVLVSVVVP